MVIPSVILILKLRVDIGFINIVYWHGWINIEHVLCAGLIYHLMLRLIMN